MGEVDPSLVPQNIIDIQLDLPHDLELQIAEFFIEAGRLIHVSDSNPMSEQHQRNQRQNIKLEEIH